MEYDPGNVVPSPEEAVDPIVAANLAKINADMLAVAMDESVGGNAASVVIKGVRSPCVAINGYADRVTGLITAFGNMQNVDREIVTRDAHFVFRVAVPWRTPEDRIVNFWPDEDFQIPAMDKLRDSAVAYNEQQPERIAASHARFIRRQQSAGE